MMLFQNFSFETASAEKCTFRKALARETARAGQNQPGFEIGYNISLFH
jgi:hypothetical protein